jgi:hypothetical protein
MKTLTKSRAREMLQRVWISGECLTANEADLLDAVPGDGTAFEKCMGAAEVPCAGAVLRIENWKDRALFVSSLLFHAICKEAKATGAAQARGSTIGDTFPQDVQSGPPLASALAESSDAPTRPRQGIGTKSEEASQ